MSRLYLSNPCAFLTTHCTRCCGRSQRPAFPAPSVRERDNEMQELGQKRVAGSSSAVIARCLGSQHLSSPAKAGDPVRRGPSAHHGLSGILDRPVEPGDDSHPKRSPLLTIFWHCGHWHFSSRTAGFGVCGNEPSTVLPEASPIVGLGNADSRRKWRDFGWVGWCRPRARDSGRVPAHPPYWRASASYRPLRAVWAVCAWALRGSRE